MLCINVLGHKLHHWGGQIQPDLHHQHHLHDGAGLGLPGRLLQPPQHRQHQAGGGLAPLQPRLPLPGDSRQCGHPGGNIEIF